TGWWYCPIGDLLRFGAGLLRRLDPGAHAVRRSAYNAGFRREAAYSLVGAPRVAGAARTSRCHWSRLWSHWRAGCSRRLELSVRVAGRAPGFFFFFFWF